MKQLLLILVVISLAGCDYIMSRSKNSKDAYLIIRNDSTFIRQTGQRARMTHSVLEVTTYYEDTTYWPIPRAGDGKYDAGDLPVAPGGYARKGFIQVKGDKVIIDVSVINTDDNKTEKSGWNGEYNLIRPK